MILSPSARLSRRMGTAEKKTQPELNINRLTLIGGRGSHTVVLARGLAYSPPRVTNLKVSSFAGPAVLANGTSPSTIATSAVKWN